MRKAEGFITNDGTFFERQEEAELHEAETKLRVKLSVDFPNLSQGKFFIILDDAIEVIGEYIDAYKAHDTAKRAETKDEIGDKVDDSEPPEAHDSLGHVSSTEEDLTSLLKLPTRGHGNVSDVGSSPRAEEVPHRRKKHGPGMR